jgi:hypothetical protein
MLNKWAAARKNLESKFRERNVIRALNDPRGTSK